MTNFHDLYQQYAKDVYRFAFWMSGRVEDAEDITSETFLRAFTAKELQVATVKAYLLTIARNLYLKRQARAWRHTPLDRDYADPTPGADRRVEHRAELAGVVAALQQLPESDRTALVMHVVGRVPYIEIGRVLGVSVGAAKVKVHRARLKLHQGRADRAGGTHASHT